MNSWLDCMLGDEDEEDGLMTCLKDAAEGFTTGVFKVGFSHEDFKAGKECSCLCLAEMLEKAIEHMSAEEELLVFRTMHHNNPMNSTYHELREQFLQVEALRLGHVKLKTKKVSLDSRPVQEDSFPLAETRSEGHSLLAVLARKSMRGRDSTVKGRRRDSSRDKKLDFVCPSDQDVESNIGIRFCKYMDIGIGGIRLSASANLEGGMYLEVNIPALTVVTGLTGAGVRLNAAAELYIEASDEKSEDITLLLTNGKLPCLKPFEDSCRAMQLMKRMVYLGPVPLIILIKVGIAASSGMLTLVVVADAAGCRSQNFRRGLGRHYGKDRV